MARRVARNVPVMMQMESAECGAACLAMILAHYGRWEPIELVRVACGVSRDGSKASNIVKAARSFGLDAKGYSCTIEGLRSLGQMPCILFWNFTHFVVLKGMGRRHAYLNDPARGAVRVTMDELDRAFTGIVLTMSPTESFVPMGRRPSIVKFARERLRGMHVPIIFVSLATLAASLATIVSTSLSSVFMDDVLGGANPDWLFPLICALAVLVAVQCAVGAVHALASNRIRWKFSIVSSSRFMWHLLHLPAAFYMQRSAADLGLRQESNDEIAATLVEQLAPSLLNASLLILYLIAMVTLSPKLTLVGLVAAALNATLATHVARRRLDLTRQHMRASSLSYSCTLAGIESIETVKAIGAEDGFFERWAGYQALTMEAEERYLRCDLYLGSLPAIITQIANVTVLVLGTVLIMKGSFTAGSLLAFQGFMSSFMGPIESIIESGQKFQEMRSSMERVQDVLDYPEVTPGSAATLRQDHQKLAGELELDHVTFGYSPLEPPLIDDLSLKVTRGSWVALVGSSGSGKSTVARLASGMYEPWSGEVRIDGTRLADIPTEVLRSSLAVVDQDIITFNDTVEANIRLWDDTIADYEVIMAANDADVHESIMERRDGYRTEIAAGGGNFSGGELQRLEIARTLALEPTIIILDEATSALDAICERHIIESLRKREVTCIVVAHRLSTIRDCDEILVLDGGKVIERGRHEELMELGGRYAELVRSS